MRSLQGRLTDNVARCLSYYKAEGQTDWSISTLYEYVQQSDKTMKRVKKKQLEAAIEKG